MPFPAGVLTRTLIVSPGPTQAESMSLEVSVESSVRAAIWEPTGEVLLMVFGVVRALPGSSAVIELPITNQSGLVDPDTQQPITDWWYKITVRYLLDGRKIGLSTTKYYRPYATDPVSQDFDLLPSGEAGLHRGPQGPRGFSAYEIAVQQGFVGTVDEWLASLHA